MEGKNARIRMLCAAYLPAADVMMPMNGHCYRSPLDLSQGLVPRTKRPIPHNNVDRVSFFSPVLISRQVSPRNNDIVLTSHQLSVPEAYKSRRPPLHLLPSHSIILLHHHSSIHPFQSTLRNPALPITHLANQLPFDRKKQHRSLKTRPCLRIW